MPSDWREFLQPLEPVDPEADRMRVRFRKHRGKVVDFVVQYEMPLDGEYRPIVRYDGSHGRAHRDLLDRDGRVRPHGKTWLPEELTFSEALKLAIEDIVQRWPNYKGEFLRYLRRRR